MVLILIFTLVAYSNGWLESMIPSELRGKLETTKLLDHSSIMFRLLWTNYGILGE